MMLNYQSSILIQRKFDKKETNDQKRHNLIGACQNYQVTQDPIPIWLKLLRMISGCTIHRHCLLKTTKIQSLSQPFYAIEGKIRKTWLEVPVEHSNYQKVVSKIDILHCFMDITKLGMVCFDSLEVHQKISAIDVDKVEISFDFVK
jgi:hypothetical protein